MLQARQTGQRPPPASPLARAALAEQVEALCSATPPRLIALEGEHELAAQIHPALVTDLDVVPKVANPRSAKDFRVVDDRRPTNRITWPMRYPTVDIHGALDRLSQYEYKGRLDIFAAFWSVPLSRRSLPFFACRALGRVYVWTVMAMGISQAPAWIQHHLSRIFAIEEEDYIIIVVVDDILWAARTASAYMRALGRILALARKHRIVMGAVKAGFGRELEMLGHYNGLSGVRPTVKYLQAIIDLPMPTTVRQARSFVGLVVCIAGHVPAAADMIRTFNRVVPPSSEVSAASSAHQRLVMTAEAAAAFEQIKRCCAHPQFRTPLRPDKQLFWGNDFSKAGGSSFLWHIEHVEGYGPAMRLVAAASR